MIKGKIELFGQNRGQVDRLKKEPDLDSFVQAQAL